MIKRVDSVEEAIICNEMLQLLIKDEKRYNCNVKDIKINNYFENLYNKDDKAIFIYKDDIVKGYIYVKIIYEDGIKEAFIDGLYVKEEYRKNGIASLLIEEVRKWCKDKGINIVALNVIEKNNKALNLYFKNGFKTESRKLKIEL